MEIAKIAADVEFEKGGEISFDEYDAIMFLNPIFAPFSWVVGWGLSREQRKKNIDKMCAFAAVKAGMIKQTQDGYVTGSIN